MAAKAGRLQIQLEMQVAQLQRDLDKANRAIKNSTSEWGRAFASTAAVFAGAFLSGAVTAAISSLSQALDGVMQRFDDIADGAKRVGMGTTAFQELAFAAGQSGVEMAELEKSLGKMQRGFGEATDKFKDALHDIGLDFDNLARMSDAARFTTIIDALGKVEDTGIRAAAGAALLGKGVQALGPLMAEGAEGIQALIDKAHELGIILDEETVAAGEAFNDQLGIMQLQLQAVVAKGLGPLLPQLQAIAEEWGKFAVEMLGAKDNADAFRIVANTVADTLVQLTNITMQTVAGVSALSKIMQVLATTASPAAAIAAGVNPLQAIGAILDENEARVKRAQQLAADMEKRLQQVRNAPPAAAAPTGTAPTTAGDTEETDKNTAAITRNVTARKDANEAKQEQIDLDKLLVGVQERANAQWQRTEQLLTDKAMAQAEAAGMSRDELEILQLQLQGYSDAQIKIAQQTQAIRTASEERAQDAARLAEEQQQLADTMARGFDDIFFSMTEGAESTQQAVARLVTELAAMYLQMLAINTLKQFNAGGTWGFGGVADGAAFDQRGMMKFAQGGIVRRATAFAFGGGMGVMGEAGPEAIMPLGRDSAGRLGVRGGGVNVNVHNYGGSQVDVQRNGQDVAIIIDQVRGVIANDFARGGNKVTSALEGAYGVRR